MLPLRAGAVLAVGREMEAVFDQSWRPFVDEALRELDALHADWQGDGARGGGTHAGQRRRWLCEPSLARIRADGSSGGGPDGAGDGGRADDEGADECFWSVPRLLVDALPDAPPARRLQKPPRGRHGPRRRGL